MADNTQLNLGTGGKKAATDEVTYSGDTADVQIVRIVTVTGAEGSKTVIDLPGDATNGLDVDVTRLPALPAGTNNIGDVDVLTMPAVALAAGAAAIGTVGVTSIAAGNNNIGDVDVASVPAPLNVVNGGAEATALRVTIATDSTGVLSVDDNGGSITVDGAVTVSDGGGSLTVDGTVALSGAPAVVGSGTEATAQRVTIATDSTGVLSVDDNGSTLSIDDGAGSITVDGTVALGAGAAAIGTVGVTSIAAGTNNIGDVDVLTLPNVTLAAGTNTNEVVGDVAHDAPAAGNPVLIAGYASAAAPADVTADADAVRAWRLRNGAAATVITAAGALIGGDATNGIDVDVTRLPALVAGSANIGDVDVLTVPADPFGVNADAASATGSISAKLRYIAATGIPVTALPALPAGNNNVGDVDIASVPAPLNVVGNGAAATALRVSLASDSTGIVALTTSAAAIGKLAANAGVNIGDVGTLGNGTNAAAIRVTIASDTTGVLQTIGKLVTLATDVTRPADTTAYVVNDVWSDSTSAPTVGGFTLTGAGRISGGSGIITDCVIANAGDAATPLQAEIMLFNQAVTAVNDNAAFAISDAEAKTLIAKIPFTLEDIGNNGWYHAQNLNIGFTCVGTANLRFLVRVKNAYAPPANSEVLTVTLKVMQVD